MSYLSAIRYIRRSDSFDVLLEYFCYGRSPFASPDNGPDHNVVRVLAIAHESFLLSNQDWFVTGSIKQNGFTCPAFAGKHLISKHGTSYSKYHLSMGTWELLFDSFNIWEADNSGVCFHLFFFGCFFLVGLFFWFLG